MPFNKPTFEITHPEFWEEAYDWAIEHSSDEATADEIEYLAEKHYEWICDDEGVEPYE